MRSKQLEKLLSDRCHTHVHVATRCTCACPQQTCLLPHTCTFHCHLLPSLDSGSLIMLVMSSKKSRRVVRKIVLSKTEQGQGILRKRELRRMFALDAVPRTVMVNLEINNCGPLAPFLLTPSVQESEAFNLIKHHPSVSPTTVKLAVALLDRFLLETCGHPGLEANTPVAQHAAALGIKMGSTYHLHFPALRQAIPLACFVLACTHVETWSPVLIRVADLDSAFTAHCPCSSKDVHEAELRVIFTLDWNIDPLTAIDVAQKLLYMVR